MPVVGCCWKTLCMRSHSHHHSLFGVHTARHSLSVAGIPIRSWGANGLFSHLVHVPRLSMSPSWATCGNTAQKVQSFARDWCCWNSWRMHSHLYHHSLPAQCILQNAVSVLPASLSDSKEHVAFSATSRMFKAVPVSILGKI